MLKPYPAIEYTHAMSLARMLKPVYAGMEHIFSYNGKAPDA